MGQREKSVEDEITQLKNTIAQQEAEIFSLKSIIDNVPGDVYWKNKEGVYTGINATGSESLRKMGFTWKQSDIVGKTDYDLYEKETADIFRANDLEIMKSGVESLREEEAILPSGEKIVQLSTKRPLLDEQGHVAGIVGNTIDITYLKEIEENLRAAKEEADKVHKAEEELRKVKYQLEGAKLISGSIAHEIRTPLATIKSGTHGLNYVFSKLIALNQFARDKNLTVETITDEEVTSTMDAIDSINRKVDQSNVIINMLLTKLQSINFEFSEFTVCSASQCIQNAISEFILPDNMADKLSFKKDNDFKFSGNGTLIMHVIMNLLKNAIFYILKADKGEIIIWLERHKKINEIHFKDTGTGIPQKVLPHIFDSFFTTESSTGTGVGLAFSKMVMQSHKGKIECLSQEGEYTEFILSFPPLDNQQF